MELKTPIEVIAALGGSAVVAAMFGEDIKTVYNWNLRGLPANTYAALAPILRKRRYSFSPKLFGQRQIQT